MINKQNECNDNNLYKNIKLIIKKNYFFFRIYFLK